MEPKKSEKEIPLHLDEILTKVGEFGRFQKLVDAVISLSYFYVSFQILLMYFLTLTPSWRCTNNSTSCKYNGTFPGEDTRRCDIKRDQWYYTKHKHFSLVTQFDVHCKKQWLLALLSSIHFVGWGVGAIVLGYLSDRYGRKKMLLPSATVILFVGFITAFLPGIYYILLCRFIVGFFIPGVMVQGNILISEIVGFKQRPLAAQIPFFMFPIGYSVLSLKAYLLQKWKMLCIVCTAPYFISLFFYPLLPESVKWLRMHHRLDEAMNVFHRIAKWNKKNLGLNIVLDSLEVTKSDQTNENSKLDVKNIVFLTAIQCFIWTVSTMSYFGLQLAAKELQGPLYRDFALLSLIHIPAVIVSIVACRKIGRKKANLIPLLLSGIVCVVIACIPSNRNLMIIRVSFGIIGKFFAGVSFQGLYIWTIELYPTHLRSKGMGIVQVAARVGATCAPWVVKGLTPFGSWVPFVVLGVSSLIGSIVGIWLPETSKPTVEPKNDAPQGIDNVENDVEL